MDILERIHQKVIKLYTKLISQKYKHPELRSVYIKELNDIDNEFFNMEEDNFSIESMIRYINLLNESTLIESGIMSALQLPKGSGLTIENRFFKDNPFMLYDA